MVISILLHNRQECCSEEINLGRFTQIYLSARVLSTFGSDEVIYKVFLKFHQNLLFTLPFDRKSKCKT